MTRSQRTALLWFLAGLASLTAGVLAAPRRPLAIVTGGLFFLVGILSITRGRRPPPPPAT